MTNPIVLAFSGGLDTSYCVPWLIETTGRPVVTVTVDTGGLDAETIGALADLSRALGAAQHDRIDAREAFFDEVLRFLVMGNVKRGHVYPLCVGAERCLQAREVAKAARRMSATAVAHGCTAAGNDQVRFEIALRTIEPSLEVLAPVRDHPRTRDEERKFLEERGLPLPGHAGAYSINRGLWGVTIGGRETLATVQSIPEEVWPLSGGAFEHAAPPRRIVLSFERGVPAGIDGDALAPVSLVERLDSIGSRYAIGRGIHLGETVLGIKGRVAFEAPAAEIVIAAHRELEKLTLTARQLRLKDMVAAVYGDLVHEGQFLEPVCRDIEACLNSSQERVSGEVTILLRPGSLFIEGVRSPFSLAAASRGRYGESAGEWTAADALGFARLSAMPGVLYHRAGQGSEN
jgi:argininosuccinate synthase